MPTSDKAREADPGTEGEDRATIDYEKLAWIAMRQPTRPLKFVSIPPAVLEQALHAAATQPFGFKFNTSGEPSKAEVLSKVSQIKLGSTAGNEELKKTDSPKGS